MAKSESSGVEWAGSIGDAPAGPVSFWGLHPEIADSKLFDEYLNRLVTGRDMHVVITAASETGVGKTTLAFALALLWDQSGWEVRKATLDPRRYSVLYDEVAPGSALILDEAEQAADTRRGMSKETVKLSHAFAGKRYRQIFGLLTAPSRSWIDDRIGSDSPDYWIQCQETPRGRPKGEAKVYRLKSSEHYGEYTPKTETITWPVLDDHPEFRRLDRKKRKWLEGTEQSEYVHREEFEEAKTNFWNKATKKTRYHIVKAMCEFGISQTDASEILSAAEHVEGLSQQRISQFVNSDSFDEVYSG